MASNSTAQTIPPTGLTIIAEADEPKVDIVFIHGFTGHPEETWRYTKVSARDRDGHDTTSPGSAPAGIRSLTILSKSSSVRAQDPPPVYWPRDLLPWRESQLRIMTYGYDTHIRHWIGQPVNRTTVYDISWDFLVALESGRREDPKRPIIFIAHSLGGIIVKEMLRRSRGCQLGQAHLHDVFQSTVGILFFGTPHSGADPRGLLQKMAEKLIKAAGFSANEDIVKTLLPSAERLRELRDEFGPMAQQQNWVIHSFQESLGVKFLGNNKVVEDTSSCLHIPSVETTEHIGRNHMDMCRFTGSDDVEYRKVASALQRILSTPPQQTLPDLQLGGLPTTEQKQILKSSLHFNQIDARHMHIRKAHTNTCVWLPGSPEYISWLDPTRFSEHQGFLWIKGKPGAGKSTLMKFLLGNYRRSRPRDTVILLFFFNARGDGLERSTAGLYRSLLLQLLERVPALLNVFDSLDCSTFDSKPHQWSIESLKELFEEAVLSLELYSVTCFIDALDECDETEIRDMLSFFEGIGRQSTSQGAKFRVCLTSRHYPHITLKKGVTLILERQTGHKRDIARFLRTELRIDDSIPAMEIRDELQRRCSGVFMWLVLVVGILNKLHDEGRSVLRLKESLNEIPHDLHHLFSNILAVDGENQDEVSLCMQWILFSRRPLKPQELYFAVQARASPKDPETLMDWDSDVVSVEAIKKFILNSSKGLAEITKSQNPVVQFIHESVRDFLLKDGLRNIIPGDSSDVEGWTHKRFVQCCLRYIKSGASDPIMQNICDGIQWLPPEEAEVQKELALSVYPFMEYAVEHILPHADAAGVLDLSELDLLEGFPRKEWIRLHNVFELDPARRHSSTSSMLYILADHNLVNLIRIHPSAMDCFAVEKSRYGAPIFAAIAKEHRQASQTMLKALVNTQPPSSAVHELYSDFCQQTTYRGYKFAYGRYQLRYLDDVIDLLKEKQEYNLLALLLTVKAYDIIKMPPYRHPRQLPLFYCLIDEKDNDGTVVILLSPGKTGHDLARVESIRIAKRWLPPMSDLFVLSSVVRTGNISAIKLLLKASRTHHIAIQEQDIRAAVFLAVCECSIEVVRLLIDQFGDLQDLLKSTGLRNDNSMAKDLPGNDSSANSLSEYYRETPLTIAIRYGKMDIVRLLLEKGADVDRCNHKSPTPLYLAILFGNAEIAGLLLEGGASCVAVPNAGYSYLSMAMKNPDPQPIVRLLLRQGMEGLPSPSMFTAIYYGDSKLLDELLDQGADVDSRDMVERTPLHYANALGDIDSFKKLCKHGADATILDKEGNPSDTWSYSAYSEMARRKSM